MTDRRIVLCLILSAILVRMAAVLVLQSHRVPHSTYEHGEIARNLLEGRGFSVRFLGAEGPTSQQAPLYPFLVAGAYALGGVETPRSLLILQLAQSLLGGVLVAAVVALAREVVPGQSLVALVAGAIAAFHPTLVYAATHVQVALQGAVFVVATLAWSYRASRTGRDRDAILAGLCLALLVLTDPILGLVFFGAIAAMVQGRGLRLAVRPVALMGLVLALGTAPWIVRNAWVHGELVLVKSSFGYAFWQGNCALSEGTDKVVRPSVERILQSDRGGLQGMNETLWAARHEAGYLDDIALTAQDYEELGRCSEPERSRRLFRRAMLDLKQEPSRFVTLSLRRLRYFVFFDETNPKTRNGLYRASHLALTAGAVLGLLGAGSNLRRRLGPTMLAVALIALFHTFTIVSARFHIPIEPILGLWAASGLTRWAWASADSRSRFRLADAQPERVHEERAEVRPATT